MEFDRLEISDGKFWKVFLHEDQTALGRLYFWYKGDERDILDVPPEALLEFHESGNIMKSALNAAFGPDMFNYLSLNNVTRHLHIHIVPRYSRKIRLSGLVFDDFSFGKRYERNPDFAVDDVILLKIKGMIQENMD